MTILGTMEEKVCCYRYEGEHSQNHLERSKVNTASKLNQVMQGGDPEVKRSGDWEPRATAKRARDQGSQNDRVI